MVQYLEKVGLNLNLEVVQAHELGKVGEVIVTKYDALFWKEKVKSLKLRKVLKKSHISTNVNEEENLTNPLDGVAVWEAEETVMSGEWE